MAMLKHVGLTRVSKNLVCLTRGEVYYRAHGTVAREVFIVSGTTLCFAGSMVAGSLIEWLFRIHFLLPGRNLW